MKKLSRLICLSLCMLLLASCGQQLTSPRYTKPAAGPEDAANQRQISRADPGYVNYLERQSMLYSATELARIVSGYDIAWRNSGSQPNPQGLLNVGSALLRIHPQTLVTPMKQSAFSQLANPVTWTILGKVGILGLYVAPTGGSAALWDYAKTIGFSDGEDVIQYKPALAIGSEDDYRAVLASSVSASGMLGGDLVPAATGIGPDFFLAARALRDYPGIYCMMEIPRELWASLPTAADEWAVTALNSEQESALAAKNVIPKNMAQERIPFLPTNGWAVTGEVRGVDGTMRRWVYRYSGTPKRPVMNWEDPSAAARRIMSGSSIRQVGLMGNALVGYHVGAWMGLDTRGLHTDTSPEGVLQPAEGAAVTIGREVRRYGGWGMLRDDAPIPFLQKVMREGPDFVQDTLFSPAAEHALLTGDASLLQFMTDEAMRYRFDMKRLVHMGSGQDGVDYSLAHLQWLASMSNEGKSDQARSLYSSVLSSLSSAAGSSGLLSGNTLYTTPAGIAAIALKTPDPTAPAREDVGKIERGHMLLMFYKAMQPGVFMPSGQDVVGLMPLNWHKAGASQADWNNRLATMGSFPLLSSADGLTLNAQGIPRANMIYSTIDTQSTTNNSLLNDLGNFIRIRRNIQIDRGELTARLSSNRSVIANVYRLPRNQSYAIVVCNFSQSPRSESLDCGRVSGLVSAMGQYTPVDITGQISTVNNNGSTLQLELPPWTGVLIYVGGQI